MKEQDRRGISLDAGQTQFVGAPELTVAETSRVEGLTQSQINLIRASIKADVKPSVLSRQFGISQAQIKAVLRAKKKRASARLAQFITRQRCTRHHLKRLRFHTGRDLGVIDRDLDGFCNGLRLLIGIDQDMTPFFDRPSDTPARAAGPSWTL
jgi:ribosomal protein S13